MAAPDFDVFLSHNSADKPTVEELAYHLKRAGIEPWLDKWHLTPGVPWQNEIERALANSASCAVFLGPSGINKWQMEEMRAAISQRVQVGADAFRVIPVLLPGADKAQRSEVPPFLRAGTWVEFGNTLDNEEAFNRLIAGIRGTAPGPLPGASTLSGRCPYKGLQSFDVDDAPFFCGREALIELALSKLWLNLTKANPLRFLAIVGSSGSGKTSLARAGLIASIKRGALPSSSAWPCLVLRPGANPLESLAKAICTELRVKSISSARQRLVDPAAVKQLVESLSGPDHDALDLEVSLEFGSERSDRRVIVLVDQFEEIFTLCNEVDLRHAFIADLLYAARAVRGQTTVILTMRADFYGQCASYPDLAAAVGDQQLLVGPMSEDELRRAIDLPAKLVGNEVEPGLTERLVQAVKNERGGLPLLQHALLELWNQRDGRWLRADVFEQKLGGLRGALNRYADRVLDDIRQKFTEEGVDICRRIFLRLVRPGEATEDTKRRARVSELVPQHDTGARGQLILQCLGDARLILIDGDQPLDAEPYAEVAHEALIREWSTLRGWIDADRAGLRTHTRLQEAADDWHRNGRDPSFLYRGARLAVGRELAQAHPDLVSGLQSDFLLAAAKAEQEALDDLRRERDAAKREARISAARLLAAQAGSVATKFPVRSLLLAVEAVRVTGDAGDATVPAAEQALRDALCSMGGVPAVCNADRGRRVALSADGRWLATTSEDGVARLWDLTAKAPDKWPLCFAHPERRMDALSFSADCRWFACGGYDLVRLWNLDGPEPSANCVTLQTPTGWVNVLAFSRDGRWLAAGCYHYTLAVWDLRPDDPARQARILRANGNPVASLAFSRDGRRLAAGNSDGTVQLWAVESDGPAPDPSVFRGHDHYTVALAFSSDGRWLVSGSQDTTVRLWDLKSPHPDAGSVVLRGHERPVAQVAFTGDRGLLATGSRDGAVRLWDLDSPDPSAQPVVLRSDGEPIEALALSCDRCWLVAGTADGTACCWNVSDGAPAQSPIVLRGHENGIGALAFSTDHGSLVTGDSTGTARRWLLHAWNSAKEPLILGDPADGSSALRFSPGGRWLVGLDKSENVRWWDMSAINRPVRTVRLRDFAEWYPTVGFAAADCLLVVQPASGESDDKRIRLWFVMPDDKAVKPILLSAAMRLRAAFDHDGRWLATDSEEDGVVQLWKLNVDNRTAELIVLKGRKKSIEALAFSGDAHWLAACGSEIRLWDLSRSNPGARPIVLDTGGWHATKLAFSADGSWLAVPSGGLEGTTSLWPLRSIRKARDPILLHGHDNLIATLQFGADCRWLATASYDRTVRLWDLGGTDPAADSIILRGHESGVVHLAFSPDGRWLATQDEAGSTVLLWDLAAGQPLPEPQLLRLGEYHLNRDWVTFSPDGRWLAAISSRGIQLWHMRCDELLESARQVAGRNLSADEWQQYFPDKPNRATFPDLSVSADQ